MFWCDFIAGWVGGSVGLAVGHPFDTLKVRQQALKSATLWTTAKDCYKYEGVHGYFKGMLYPILSAGALNSLFFGVYGVTLRLLHSHRHENGGRPKKTSGDANAGGVNSATSGISDHKPSNADIFWAGCAGGVAQLAVACPIDIVKIKLQTQTDDHHLRYKGPYDCLRQIYRRQGVRGWYQGLVVMAWRDTPTFGLYTILYNHLLVKCTGHASPQACQFFAGGMAGVLSWMSVIYLDVVKSRIQADDPFNPKYRGMIDCFRQCYREAGFRIFFRGLLAVSLRAFPLNGTTFLGYEYVMAACKKLHLED